MMREAIERDFNHPSIFAWCLFNETWGFGGQNTFLDKLLPAAPGLDRQRAAEASPSPDEPARQSCTPEGSRGGQEREKASKRETFAWSTEESDSGGVATVVAKAEPDTQTQQLDAPKIWVQKMWESSWVKPLARKSPCTTPDLS